MMNSDPIFNIWNGIVVIGGTIIACVLWRFYRSTHSRPLLNSIPGIYTSLGLLGTFMSIVFALGDIDENKLTIYNLSDNSTTSTETESKTDIGENEELTFEEIVDKENGVRTLNDQNGDSSKDSKDEKKDPTIQIIKDLVPAFTSSILGLLLALLSTVACKIKFAREDEELDQLVGNLTPEECLHQIMDHCKQTNTILLSQEDATKLYNEQLKLSIGEQNKVLQRFIDEFVKKMGNIFDNMKSSITAQVESIGNVQLSRAGGILSEISTQLGSVTEQILYAQTESVEGLVASTNTQLETMAQSIASQYAVVQQNANENIANMKSLKEQFVKTNQDVLQKATDMNKQTIDEVKGSIEELVSGIKESVSTECKALNDALIKNISALDKSYDFIKDRIAQITHDYEQAGLAFADAVTNSHRQNETTENAIKRANESLSLVEETNKNINELLQAFNTRQDNIETLVAHINEMSSTIAMLQKLETQLKRLNK